MCGDNDGILKDKAFCVMMIKANKVMGHCV